MVTTEALKLLYKKLGGTADVESITSISDMVDLIEDVAGGGGGGASGLVVHIITENETTYLDKTYTEIVNSLNSGIMPVIKEASIDDENTTYTSSIVAVYGVNAGQYLIGIYAITPGGNLQGAYVSDSADGTLILQ